MTVPNRLRATYNVALMEDDAAEKGWNQAYLARVIGRDRGTVSRFFTGEVQTPKVAKELADALGRPVRRYHIRRTAMPRESVA